MTSAARDPVRGRRRSERRHRGGSVGSYLVLVALAVFVLYAAVSVLYLASFRAERAAGTVILAATASLLDDAVRLGEAFAAGGEGRSVLVVDAAGQVREVPGPAAPGPSGFHPPDRAEGQALARLLEEGRVDFVLAEGEALEALPGSGSGAVARFTHPRLLAVPFPSALVGATLAEAGAALEAAASGGPSPWPGVTVRVVDLADRGPGLQLLEVEGLYPSLKAVLDGTYPLVVEAGVVGRRPKGILGLPALLPPVRAWVQAPNRAAREFAAWVGGQEALRVFHGTDRELVLCAVGDVMLARNVGRDIAAYGLDWPFGLVADRLRAADITVANLEAPLGTTGTPIPGKLIWFRAKPEYVECLLKAGIDVVNLANNHILDYDSPCLLETFEVLDRAGVAYFGAGTDDVTARRPAVLEAAGLKVAFLGYTEFADPGLYWDPVYRRTFVAAPGVPGCNPLDLELVAEDIERAKAAADLVVVVYHWGMEDINYPQAWNPANDIEAIARRTVELGADLVLGTHPHAIQGYEAYRDGLICYSLGNFVMDQKRPVQKESMVLEVWLGPEGVLSARVTPCWIDTTRPRVLEGAEAAALLEKIETISRGFRTSQ